MVPGPDEEDADETEIGPAPRRPATQPPAEPLRPCLIVISGFSAGQVFALTEPETLAGRAPGNAIRLKDGGVSRVHARFMLSAAGVELEDLSSTGTVVNNAVVKRRALRDGDKIQLGGTSVLLFTMVDATREAIESNLLAGAMRDPLTGAWTRRRLISQLEQDLAYARRHRDSLTLMIAVPFWSGSAHEPDSILDAVIGGVADRIRGEIGPAELFARWTKSSFAICLRESDEQKIDSLALSLSRSVSAKPIITDLGERQVSLSVVPIAAASAGTESVRALVLRADAVAQEPQQAK